MNWEMTRRKLPEMFDDEGWCLRSKCVLVQDKRGEYFTGHFFRYVYKDELEEEQEPVTFIEYGRDGYSYDINDIILWSYIDEN